MYNRVISEKYSLVGLSVIIIATLITAKHKIIILKRSSKGSEQPKTRFTISICNPIKINTHRLEGP